MLMLQSAAQETDDSAYVFCHTEDSMADLKRFLNNPSAPGKVYIDEITSMPEFCHTASVLPNKYAVAGKKIVIAGTDSYALAIAGMDDVYDKCHFIHTTYIPYAEYNRLTGNDLAAYVERGGVLSSGDIFSGKESSDRYFRASIARNLERSLERAGRDGEFGSLRPFYERGEFSSFIKKIVELSNRTFLARTVNRRFKSHDFGSLREIMEKHPRMTEQDFSFLVSGDMRKRLLEALNIREPLLSHATDETMEQARDYLEWADVIYRVPKTDEVIFTQPGLRYSQLESEREILESIDIPEDSTGELRTLLLEKLESDIWGQMLEDIVFYQLARDESICKEFKVRKFAGVAREKAGLKNREIDICLLSRKGRDSYWLEIKNSCAVTKEQTAHIKSEAFQELFMEKTGHDVVGELVLYRGKTWKDASGVLYCSVSDFLLSPQDALEAAKELKRDSGR